MKRLAIVLCVAIVAILLPLSAAAQHPAHADSPKATLTLSDDLGVGPIVLKAGGYWVRCRTIDGKTFLVVTFADGGKEAARVPCVREVRDEKVAVSQFLIVRNASGQRTLTVVRIKGEMSEHRVVIE